MFESHLFADIFDSNCLFFHSSFSRLELLGIPASSFINLSTFFGNKIQIKFVWRFTEFWVFFLPRICLGLAWFRLRLLIFFVFFLQLGKIPDQGNAELKTPYIKYWNIGRAGEIGAIGMTGIFHPHVFCQKEEQLLFGDPSRKHHDGEGNFLSIQWFVFLLAFTLKTPRLEF